MTSKAEMTLDVHFDIVEIDSVPIFSKDHELEIVRSVLNTSLQSMREAAVALDSRRFYELVNGNFKLYNGYLAQSHERGALASQYRDAKNAYHASIFAINGKRFEKLSHGDKLMASIQAKKSGDVNGR